MAGRAPQPAVQPSSGRKAKAPPPPSETKTVTDCPFDDTESANIIMEQKENVIDKDIELSVVLPGDVIKYTTVNGRKPMMDLLIFLCAQYHLNPSSYTIELISAENSQIKFKPNTPVGMLEVEKVIVKPKQMDKKKPAPVIPEQTVRVVINYKKTQKTVVRVSPYSPLQELLPIICSKCEFDPSHTVLLKNYQSQEALDMTKSLNDLGLRELYAMDISRAASPVDLNLPSLKDSDRVSENSDVLKEKENKGFFSFFQRSKKKREQTASAPATPLMSKPRPTFTTRSSTVSKQYDSNTLPSEMPKKRRAPLPPMPNSLSAPQELAEARTEPDIVKSNSLGMNDQAPLGLVRKGSLPLSDTASVSSLRRMKRKAPSPPSRTPEDQSESSNGTVTESRESVLTEVEGRAAEMRSETGARTSEYSLEEIDEKEEMSVQEGEESGSTDTSLRTGEVTAAFSSTEVPLETERNDRASSVPVAGTVSVDNSQSFEEEKQENMSTDGKELQTQISSDQDAFEKDRKLRILEQNKNHDHSSRTLLPTNEDAGEKQTAKIKAEDFSENSKLEADRLSNCQASKNDIAISHSNYTQMIPGKQDQKTSQTSLDTVKTHDVAIQTGPLVSNLGRTEKKEMIVPQDYESSTFKRMVHQHNTDTNNPGLRVMQGIHKDEETSTEQNLQRQEVSYEKAIPMKDEIHICTNGSNVTSLETIAKTPEGSPIRGYPLYRQDMKPKLKPANEITRDYIPKIGMTTYKIVPPPKSLETMKSWESDVSDSKAQEVSASKNTLEYEDPKELIMQTEIPHLPKSTGHLQTGLQNIPTAKNDLLHRMQSTSEHGVPSGTRVTSEVNQIETVSSKQLVPPVLTLSNTNASSETQEKSNALSPTTAKPSSFYLQMQRRVSGHYVSSAIARNTICAPNSIQSEVKNTELEKKISSPDETALLTTSSSSLPVEDKDNDGKRTESSTSPVKNNKPPSSPSCQPAPLNLRTLRTFAVPKPYSSSRPSPFALAVSSAVKRSQSFNKTRTVSSLAPREECPVELSSASSAAESSSATSMPQVKTPSLHSVIGGPQNSLMDKKSSNVSNSEQKIQAQSGASADHPRPIIMRQTSTPVQRSDPEQIHQSLLAAIRSGEAAARLKRVGPPSNTVSVNGRARLNHLYSTEAKANH
ncbi:cordon-bleu protein-like 1 isoform X2 [Coturnix japonica]|uniref:Cordon-bleu WH2 repeat protein like 1 n=1 Tax=Coturnix japonica TaxID=93934 RepID=A0A8C2TXZ1_COTJA|nr:cordon-bleu protein-like 1 isoform X2 [Coturnix japonica]